MFACAQRQYKPETKGMLKIHHNNLHQDIEYSCHKFCQWTKSKGGLKSHQVVMYEEKKYVCKECDNQATSKGGLTQHK